MSLLNELHKSTNKTARTENGAISNASTLDALLDFFSNAGAMRGRTADAVNLFKRAFSVDPTNTMRCLFYLRDIRGGQGERAVFKAILASLDNETLKKVFKFIPEYGRWDEVPINKDTQAFLYEQLQADEKNMEAGKSVSLLAKWLPSENASSKDGKRDAEALMTFWNLKPRQYRTRVVALRKYYDNFLERLMSENRWAEIDYSKLPAQAHRKHVAAFKRHDGERYQAFLDSVVRGEQTVNAGTLFTYEVFDLVKSRQDAAANAMWKNLPDYTNGQNALVLADVSGSMTGRPMSISVSLALYFAERNEGPFKDHFMTFTDQSRLVKVQGATLTDRLRFIESRDWGMSTNLQSAFDAILAAAKRSNASQDEMPQVLYIISDMQFNIATSGNNETNLEAAERKFREAGYELPHVVFWNCNARGNDAPATMYDNKVTLISGSNQSTFQYVLANKTPIQSMMDILTSDRYAQITV